MAQVQGMNVNKNSKNSQCSIFLIRTIFTLCLMNRTSPIIFPGVYAFIERLFDRPFG